MTTGQKLREARNERGFSQSQLAHRTATQPHVTSISDWERGRNVPTLRHLNALASALDKPVSHFMADTPPSADLVSDLTSALTRLVDERLAQVVHA